MFADYIFFKPFTVQLVAYVYVLSMSETCCELRSELKVQINVIVVSIRLRITLLEIERDPMLPTRSQSFFQLN